MDPQSVVAAVGIAMSVEAAVVVPQLCLLNEYVTVGHTQ